MATCSNVLFKSTLSQSNNYYLLGSVRYLYYKFERVKTPPLPEPQESPYIVGPYLKPKYMPVKYITEPIRQRHDDHLNYFIYKPIAVDPNEGRTVRLLLIEDVEGLGIAGQTVDAPHRAARLVAMRKAEYASEFAYKWYKFGSKTSLSASTALSPRTLRLLKSQVFKLPISGQKVVRAWHLSLALRLAGCICPIEAIDEKSIKDNEDGLVECTLRINNHEVVTVKFEHVSTERVEDD